MINNLKKKFNISKYKSLKWEKYFEVYENIFNKFRNKKIIFVEIGIFQGGSLEIWRKYFGKKARIIGIDLNPNCKKFKKKGIEIFIGDQSSPVFWKKFFRRVGKVDIVLDDGGHTNKQQISTVLNTIKQIKNGGRLIVKDTHTSYDKKFGNPSKYSFINFAKQVIDDVNQTYPFKKIKKFKYSINKYVYGISFYESIVEFKINRKKCYQNIFMDNFGHSSNFKDFRNESSWLIRNFKKFKQKTGLFKKIKLQKINYLIENRSLKKFFN